MHPVPRASTLYHLIQVYLSGCRDEPCNLDPLPCIISSRFISVGVGMHPVPRAPTLYHLMQIYLVCLCFDSHCEDFMLFFRTQIVQFHRLCQWPPPMLFLHASGAQSQPKQMPKIRLSIWKAFNTASPVAKKPLEPSEWECWYFDRDRPKARQTDSLTGQTDMNRLFPILPPTNGVVGR